MKDNRMSKKSIDAEVFETKMKKIKKIKDKEISHRKADDLLCETLEDLGYNEGIKIYKRISKWYA